MNKLTLPIAIIALITSVGSFFFLQPSTELVYVDVNKLLEGYNRTEIVKKAFDKKAQTMKANVDSLVSNWQTETQSV